MISLGGRRREIIFVCLAVYWDLVVAWHFNVDKHHRRTVFNKPGRADRLSYILVFFVLHVLCFRKGSKEGGRREGNIIGFGG